MGPKDAAAAPDTAPARLLSLAARHPDAVLGNPALPLIDLEQPGVGAEIRRVALLTQALTSMRRLAERTAPGLLVFWACDVVEPLAKPLADPRLDAHLRLVRAFACGDAEKRAVDDSCDGLPLPPIGNPGLAGTIRAVRTAGVYPMESVEYARVAYPFSGDKRTAREVVLDLTARLAYLRASGLPDPRQLPLFGERR